MNPANSLKLLRVLLGLAGRFCSRCTALFGSKQGDQNVSFHARRRFDLTLLANFRKQTSHLRATNFLMGHFASAVKDHSANLVTFAEESENLALANLKIVFRRSRTKLNFLELRTTAALSLFVSLLALLIQKLAVIRNFANWRIGGRRNFHQIKASFACQSHALKRLHYTKLGTFIINHPDFPSANSFVNTNTVGLPEIPLSDKSP